MKRGEDRLLSGKKILLGVTGGIGAYKAAFLVRELLKAGAQVSVVMTSSATQFITPLTMETLSGRPVGLDMFSLTEERTIGHIDRAGWADLFLVAPATANFIGKAANGIADDLLTTISLAVTCPTVLAPAMNSRMWAHPAVQKNLATLVERGAVIVPPGVGELACGEEGPGRLADPEEILEMVASRFAGGDLEGIRVLVTAGPTQEAIDPVRYISNRSSGRMGYALAADAAHRGARVTLVSGPVALSPPPVHAFRSVRTAGQMLDAVLEALPDADWVIMAAAVADFRPEEVGEEKIKKEGKEGLDLKLTRNPDILKTIAPLKENRLYVGFAAETRDLVKNARKKVREKKLDLIVANDVSGVETGFESEENSGTILDRKDLSVVLPRMTKAQMAGRILDVALGQWTGKGEGS